MVLGQEASVAKPLSIECRVDTVERQSRSYASDAVGSPLSNLNVYSKEFYLDANTISATVSEGVGRPVVFLHGNSSCKEIWAYQICAMRRLGRPVLAPDLPGHGNSSNAGDPADTYSFPGYAAVVGALLDQLKWTSVDLVGWSLGGHIGLELLATDKRVRSLAIVGTPPARPGPEALDVAFHSAPSMQLTGKRDFSEADAVSYVTNLLGGHRWVSHHHLDAVRRTDGLARQCMLENALKGRGVDQRRLVERDDTRLCVMHGEKDPFVRLDYLLSLNYRNLWSKQVHLFSGAGHAPHWQYPDAFNTLLCAFLSERQIHPAVGSGSGPAGD